MKINGMINREYCRFKNLSSGDAFIHENMLFIKGSIYNEEISSFVGDIQWKDTAISLPDGMIVDHFTKENPIVEKVDITVEVLNKVLN